MKATVVFQFDNLPIGTTKESILDQFKPIAGEVHYFPEKGECECVICRKIMPESEAIEDQKIFSSFCPDCFPRYNSDVVKCYYCGVYEHCTLLRCGEVRDENECEYYYCEDEGDEEE